jgi:hypothetical protein
MPGRPRWRGGRSGRPAGWGWAEYASRDHRLPVQPVDDHRLGTRLAQLRDLAGRPGGGDNLMTRCDQPRNQVPSQRPGRSGDEDSHDLSFRVMLSFEDKAPPEAVTLPGSAFRTAQAYSRPRRPPGLGIKNDLHAARHTAEPTRTPPSRRPGRRPARRNLTFRDEPRFWSAPADPSICADVGS